MVLGRHMNALGMAKHYHQKPDVRREGGRLERFLMGESVILYQLHTNAKGKLL